MLSDHEKYGDTYAQWGGPMYTVITRDTSNIRAILSGHFKCNLPRAHAAVKELTFVQLLKLAVAGVGVSGHY